MAGSSENAASGRYELSLDNMVQDPSSCTLDNLLDCIGFGPFQYKLLFVAGLTLFADAAELLLLPYFPSMLPCLFPGSDSGDRNAAVSVIFMGMLFGSILAGPVADLYGRRMGYLVTCLLCLVFGILSAFTSSIHVFTLCRFFVGIGVGGASPGLSLFMEMSPKAYRGKAAMGFFFMFSLGGIVIAILQWIVYMHFGWRAALAAAAGPALLQLLCFPFLSESARFLVTHGDMQGAARTLKSAAAKNGKVLDGHKILVCLQATYMRSSSDHAAEVPHEPSSSMQNGFSDSQHTIDNCHGEGRPRQSSEEQDMSSSSTSPKGMEEREIDDGLRPLLAVSMEESLQQNLTLYMTFKQLLSDGLRRRFLQLSALFFTMAIVYYMIVMLSGSNSAGTSELGPCLPAKHHLFIAVLISNCSEVPGLLIAYSLVDKIGRRKTIATNFMLCAAAMCLAEIVKSDDWLFSGAIALARCVALAFNQSIWLYAAEIFPTTLRSTGVGSTAAFARVGGSLSPFILDFLKPDEELAFTFVMVSMCTLGAVLALSMPAETSNQALEDTV